MGDYRYFPEQPGPARGVDPYAQPVAGDRMRGVDRAQPRGYAPQLPPHAPSPYADPYGHDDNLADYDYGLPAHDPYAPPMHPTRPLARGAHPTPPLTQGRGYAPRAYAEHPYVPVAPQRGTPMTGAIRPQAYDDSYADPRLADPRLAAPSWVRPQGAQAAPPSDRPTMRPTAVLHGLGAVMSLGLVVLAGAWTWNMMQRDVSGVPVVRALEGPMRVAPENPGGQQAAFQGLAINELAGAGASTEADVIVLAPPPVGLGAGASPSTDLPALTDVAFATDATPAGPALGFISPNRQAVERSPRPRGRDNAGVQMAASPISAPAPQAPSLSTSNDPNIADSLAASIAQSVALDLAGPRGIDVDPASIGPGTRLVQLGAYDNPDEARGAWDALSSRFSPLLNDRGRVIEAAHSGGSVFYRLRAHGFSDERDARRFCAALVAEQIDCIPVLVR